MSYLKVLFPLPRI